VGQAFRSSLVAPDDGRHKPAVKSMQKVIGKKAGRTVGVALAERIES